MGTGRASASVTAPMDTHAAFEHRESATVQLPATINDRRGTGWVKLPLLLIALLWLVAVGWGAHEATSGRQLNAAVAVSWLSVASAPLALLAAILLLWQATSERRMVRLVRATGVVRAEAAELEDVLQRLGHRATEARIAVAAQAQQLEEIGGLTSSRLLTVGETLREGTALLSRHAAILDDAAEAARADLGVMLADLPLAQRQLESFADAITRIGSEAAARLDALTGGAAELQAASQHADALATGAAQVLVHQLGRIDEAAAGAVLRIGAAAQDLPARVADACARADAGLETLRQSADAQAHALLALVEQSRAAITVSGGEARQALRRDIEQLAAAMSGLGEQLAAEDEQARLLLGNTTRQLAEIETRQVALTEAGVARAKTLSDALSAIASEIEQLTGLVGASDLASGAAADRVDLLRTRLAEITTILSRDMPALIDAAAPGLEALGSAADIVASRLDAAVALAEAAVERTEAAAAQADRVGVTAGTQLDMVQAKIDLLAGSLETLARALAQTDADAGALANSTAPKLLDALLRAREAGQQAAERVREVLAALAPQTASLIGDSARAALDDAIAGRFEAQAARINEAADRALASSRESAALIAERIVAIDAAADAAEARVAAGQASLRETGDDSFSRRFALMIESLNSTAIDVTKILSNEVTDSAWAAYLKGDRGVFARRAVRLLDNGESREVVRHYEADAEFRGQVDRYIHDFEAMLRDVLTLRSGTPMGVTLLSSDVGKLYVALAQSIERLRA